MAYGHIIHIIQSAGWRTDPAATLFYKLLFVECSNLVVAPQQNSPFSWPSPSQKFPLPSVGEGAYRES